MVDRYKMTAPLSIRVVACNEACIRTICGNHDPATGWQLIDQTSSIAQSPELKWSSRSHYACKTPEETF